MDARYRAVDRGDAGHGSRDPAGADLLRHGAAGLRRAGLGARRRARSAALVGKTMMKPATLETSLAAAAAWLWRDDPLHDPAVAARALPAARLPRMRVGGIGQAGGRVD